MLDSHSSDKPVSWLVKNLSVDCVYPQPIKRAEWFLTIVTLSLDNEKNKILGFQLSIRHDSLNWVQDTTKFLVLSCTHLECSIQFVTFYSNYFCLIPYFVTLVDNLSLAQCLHIFTVTF